VLPLGKVGAFLAAGGAGKTMALTQLAVAVATGTKWLDTFDVATPGAVLLALAEEDAEEMRRRLFNAANLLFDNDGDGRPRTDAEVRALTATALQRIVCLPLAGQRVALVEGAGGSITESPMLADMQARLDAMKNADGDPVAWRLIILDPLSRWSGSDTEKDNASATRFVEAVESLAMKTAGRPTVLIAHHTGKNSRGGANDENAARGVTALTDGVRWVASMYPDEIDDWVCLKIPTKSNYTATCKEPWTLLRDNERGGALRLGTKDERAARASAIQAAKEKAGA
jgi:RecA-family ATPase